MRIYEAENAVVAGAGGVVTDDTDAEGATVGCADSGAQAQAEASTAPTIATATARRIRLVAPRSIPPVSPVTRDVRRASADEASRRASIA